MSCDASCHSLEDEQEALFFFFIAIKLIHSYYGVTYLCEVFSSWLLLPDVDRSLSASL